MPFAIMLLRMLTIGPMTISVSGTMIKSVRQAGRKLLTTLGVYLATSFSNCTAASTAMITGNTDEE